MAKRILVVEDDPGLSKILSDNLTHDGFIVRCARDAHHAVSSLSEFMPDLVLLDLMLPDVSGFDLVGTLRQGGRTPVIIVSARAQRADKLKGLDLGADDYVVKPVDMEELVARINAVLRRSAPSVTTVTIGRLTVDFQHLTASTPRGRVHLTHREFEILRFLAAHRNRAVHRDQLLAEVWGYLDGSTTRSVDFAIARLRKKIEPNPHNPRYIKTVHGDGYCLVADTPADPR